MCVGVCVLTVVHRERVIASSVLNCGESMQENMHFAIYYVGGDSPGDRS